MREKKRRTFIMLLSQDDFMKENFGVEDYSKEYHKEVLRRWKAHLKNKNYSAMNCNVPESSPANENPS